MNKLLLSEIYIYPVKSLGGISVREAEVTDRGLKYDRRWMLVDYTGKFLSQRSHPLMSIIKVDISSDRLIFRDIRNTEQFDVGIDERSGKVIKSVVWDDAVETHHVNSIIDDWFGVILNTRCKLVFMPDESFRPVDKRYAAENEITSLSDGYPFLVVGQSSLDDLNSKLEEKIPMNRFRPNLVLSGGYPFEEDDLKSFSIGDVFFYSVKPCARCVVTTINQQTAQKSDEPLKTLSKYRMVNNKVMFGMNLLHKGKGKINMGDEAKVLERK